MPLDPLINCVYLEKIHFGYDAAFDYEKCNSFEPLKKCKNLKLIECSQIMFINEECIKEEFKDYPHIKIT